MNNCIKFFIIIFLIFVLCPHSNYSRDINLLLITWDCSNLLFTKFLFYHGLKTKVIIQLFKFFFFSLLNIYNVTRLLWFLVPFTIIVKKCKSHVPLSVLSPNFLLSFFKHAFNYIYMCVYACVYTYEKI